MHLSLWFTFNFELNGYDKIYNNKCNGVNFIKSYKMQQIYKGYNFVELLIGLNFKLNVNHNERCMHDICL